MIVRCYRALEENEKIFAQAKDDISVGNKYFVLEVEVGFRHETLYRLVADNAEGMPALYSAMQFDIIDSRIPSCWGIYKSIPTLMTLTPKAWQEYDSGDPEYDFWDHCYDAEPNAHVLYRKVLTEMHAELGWDGD